MIAKSNVTNDCNVRIPGISLTKSSMAASITRIYIVIYVINIYQCIFYVCDIKSSILLNMIPCHSGYYEIVLWVFFKFR